MTGLIQPRRKFLRVTLNRAVAGSYLGIALPVIARAKNESAPALPVVALQPMMALAQASKQRVICVGARGSILLADTNQNSVPVALEKSRTPALPTSLAALLPPIAWQISKAQTDATLTSLKFTGGNRGFVVGHSACVLRTDDAGLTWKVISPAPGVLGTVAPPFFDVAIAGENDLIVVGAFGKALRSRDGGSSWQVLNLPNPKGLHLYSVSHLEGVWLIVGEQGLIIQSIDNGQSWVLVTPPAAATWFGLLQGKDGALTVHGLQGTVLHRNVGSASFSQISVPNKSTVTAAAKLQDGSVVLAMQTGQLVQWRNGNPIAQILPFASPFPVTAMLSVLDEKGESLWVAGLRGALRFSLNA
jgi:hypothetical protein